MMNRIINHLNLPKFPDNIHGLFVLGGVGPKYIGSTKELLSWVGSEEIKQHDDSTWETETFTIFPIFPRQDGTLGFIISKKKKKFAKALLRRNVPFVFQAPNMFIVLGCIHAFREAFD